MNKKAIVSRIMMFNYDYDPWTFCEDDYNSFSDDELIDDFAEYAESILNCEDELDFVKDLGLYDDMLKLLEDIKKG